MVHGVAAIIQRHLLEVDEPCLGQSRDFIAGSPVTPTIRVLKFSMYERMISGRVAYAGSTETKKAFMSVPSAPISSSQPDSSTSVVGQISGQWVKPKNTAAGLPARARSVIGLPGVIDELERRAHFHAGHEGTLGPAEPGLVSKHTGEDQEEGGKRRPTHSSYGSGRAQLELPLMEWFMVLECSMVPCFILLPGLISSTLNSMSMVPAFSNRSVALRFSPAFSCPPNFMNITW